MEQDSTESSNAPSGESDPIVLDLGASEAKLLLKACQRYRVTIPSYLQSKQAEIQMIDHLIQKLSK